ncbi:transcriptional regulator [Vibrio nigripulchritudo ATCC 27043]|uniref:LysR family transcriptional regulator n=1 Tax=Vibrio nigripulchritudo TaxID=28173 RepID=UPI00021C1F88|nr:LysR family transcriptional regulator [Vibrio nigripulchritudo]EGU57671.1 transcriptional regulator [Vibrio nigripulchritudo ATCC 27043]
MDWMQSVKSYIRVVEEGSFNGAARRLNTTSSAISKRILWLEGVVGAQLLKRTTRSISLTEAGALFFERSVSQMEQWQSIVDETRSVTQAPVGRLKIGATVAVGSRFIVRYLDDFLSQYPDIKVQLVTTVPGQLPELDLDVYISRELEQMNSLSFIATPLFEYPFEFFASPQYLEQHGVPQQLDDLSKHNMLIWGEQLEREFFFENKKRVVFKGNFATTNPEALYHAVKTGMGILISSKMMIRDMLDSGEVVQVLPGLKTETTTIYAYYPKLDYEHTRTRLFIEHLKNRLAQEIPSK